MLPISRDSSKVQNILKLQSKPFLAIGDGDQCSPSFRHPTLLNANIYPVVPNVKPATTKTVNGVNFARDKYGREKDENQARISDNILPRVPSEAKLTPKHNVGMGRTISSPVNLLTPEKSVGKYEDAEEEKAFFPDEKSGSGPCSGRSPDSRPSSPDNAEIPAEHYYIETILARQARKMLEG